MKIYESDTIAAIATPMGEGGIGMVLLFAFADRDGMTYRILLPLFGTTLTASFVLYVYNTWKTIALTQENRKAEKEGGRESKNR